MVNPISTGERLWNLTPSGFSRVVQKREKILAGNLVTFPNNKWVTNVGQKFEDESFLVGLAVSFSDISVLENWERTKTPNFIYLLK